MKRADNPRKNQDKDTKNPSNHLLSGVSSNGNFPEISQADYISNSVFRVDVWLFDETKEAPKLKGMYKDGLLQLLKKCGYFKYPLNGSVTLVRSENNIIVSVAEGAIKDAVEDILFRGDASIRFTHRGKEICIRQAELKECFLQEVRHLFNRKFLENLEIFKRHVLADDKNVCHLFFKNSIIKVSSEGVKRMRYSSLKKEFVWKEQVCPHRFKYMKSNTDCHFARFISNISGRDPKRIKNIRSAIGYLLHAYNDPTRGQAVLCYDDVDYRAENPEGGRGKGVLVQALQQVRRLVKIDGKRFSTDDKFRFQEVRPETQIIFLDDVKKGFDFDQLNSVLTDGMNVEVKYHPSYLIPAEQAPKFVITSNYPIDNEGTTRKRRQFVVEFSDFYSKQIVNGTEEPIVAEHGCRFFTDEWDAAEWNKFYSYMMDCILLYMKEGLVSHESMNLKERGLAQKTSKEFVDWANGYGFNLETTYKTKELYESFIAECDNPSRKQRGLTNWLKHFAAYKGWKAYCDGNNGTDFIRFKI